MIRRCKAEIPYEHLLFRYGQVDVVSFKTIHYVIYDHFTSRDTDVVHGTMDCISVIYIDRQKKPDTYFGGVRGGVKIRKTNAQSKSGSYHI